MQKELNLIIKNNQTQTAKLFKVAKLQNMIVFGLNYKFIANIESRSNLVLGFIFDKSFITFNCA